MGLCNCSPAEFEDKHEKSMKESLLARKETNKSQKRKQETLYNEIICPLELYPKLGKICKEWKHCADCNDINPKWAEISRGSLICIECSGVHRSLGTDISKVRSINLDKWTQEMVDNMVESDIEFNKKWEYHVNKQYMKPTYKSTRDVRSKYIVAKYKKLAFIKQSEELSPLSPAFITDDIKETEDDKYNVGMIQYSGYIEINVISADNLPKAPLFTDSDSYVIFNNNNGQNVKSKIIYNDNNPKWNEKLVLSVNENEKPILIEVYSEDKLGDDDLLCSSKIDIKKQCKNGEKVKFNMKMNVTEKYKQQNTNSLLNFTVIYNKLVAR